MRLVLGVQPVREALRAHGQRTEEVIIERGDHPQLQALARFARDQGVPVTLAARSELDRRARGVRHQGAMALVPELRLVALDELIVDPRALFVALDEISDPQNLPLSPATFRASAGAVEHAVLCRVAALPSAIQHLAQQGAAAIGLDAQGDIDLAAVDLSGPVVLVIGSEGKGLKKSVRRACARIARLPMAGAIASLNASAAAAIALYEARRQRHP